MLVARIKLPPLRHYLAISLQHYLTKGAITTATAIINGRRVQIRPSPPSRTCAKLAASPTAVRLELKPEVQAFIHQRAHRHGLIQVDWHSHPGAGQSLGFSATDDAHESELAAYLADRMERIPFGSVVVNDDHIDARLWITEVIHPKRKRTAQSIAYRPQAHTMQAVWVGDLQRRIPVTTQRANRAEPAFVSPIHDRQVRAFGAEFQRQIGALRVGLVGLGGLGSALAAHLARLGVQDWVLVDPDVVELSNLNRLVHAATIDAQKARPKVFVARSSIHQSNPKAVVRALRADVFEPAAQAALKACDLLIAATDETIYSNGHSCSKQAITMPAVSCLVPPVMSETISCGARLISCFRARSV